MWKCPVNDESEQFYASLCRILMNELLVLWIFNLHLCASENTCFHEDSHLFLKAVSLFIMSHFLEMEVDALLISSQQAVNWQWLHFPQIQCVARAPPEGWRLRGMSACGRKALTLLSSVFAVCSLGLLGIAVSTDYWLYLEEGVILPLNQSTDIRMSIHSGLWRVCFLAGELHGWFDFWETFCSSVTYIYNYSFSKI